MKQEPKIVCGSDWVLIDGSWNPARWGESVRKSANGRPEYSICSKCDIRFQIQLRRMPNGVFRDQPQCSRCRSKKKVSGAVKINYQTIPTNKIKICGFNPEVRTSPKALTVLQDSIERSGILVALAVAPVCA